ncbi:MAG: glucans biosynthesis glucosyltransferase MdoH [bacterium]
MNEPTSMPLSPLRRSGRRQAFFFTSVVVLTGLATWVMADILWRGGVSRIEMAVLILFVPLFGMVTLGFMQAVCGFFILLRRKDPYSISRTIPDAMPLPGDMPATAIAVPIFNEDVSRVYEGLRVIYLDLVRSGHIGRFDIFILSDSNDPNKWIEEEVAWIDLCKQVKGFGRIFYRKRRLGLNRKSGNISDFLRRWGRKYRYMVVLDADSLMEARTLVRLVQLMEVNQQAGIIQTVPAPIQGRTFFARLMQFAGTLYGPVFQAGLNYWQAGCGNFWGHNAIIRVAPFMEHCALPTLTAGANTRFMSHDYVEAALMRRANYEVWMDYELGGSFENLPPTPLDHASRDRRWCRGNLQHAWLITAQGLHPINRLHLFLGILSYLASPLWLIFLVLGSISAWIFWAGGTVLTFDSDVGFSSFLDIGGGRLALMLFFCTLGLLTVPKILAVLLALKDRERREKFGGGWRIIAGFLVEHTLSALMAPVQMLFNSRFIAEILSGRDVPWNPQSRDAGTGIDWEAIIKSHTGHTVVGLAWAFLAFRISPVFFWWLSPVTFGLIGSIPISAMLSTGGLGKRLRQMGFFTIPVENKPPAVIRHLDKNLRAIRHRIDPPDWLAPHYGIMQVVLDPYLNAAHSSLLRHKPKVGQHVTRDLHDLQERLLAKGPAALNRREQMAVLMNVQAVADLHDHVWRMPESSLSPWWRLAMRHYNTLTDRPQTALYR